ncbi:MAG: hypothetical protein CVU43_15840, partial [Chloroflexi bacterium HGW-Chloroflexi-5]
MYINHKAGGDQPPALDHDGASITQPAYARLSYGETTVSFAVKEPIYLLFAVVQAVAQEGRHVKIAGVDDTGFKDGVIHFLAAGFDAFTEGWRLYDTRRIETLLALRAGRPHAGLVKTRGNDRYAQVVAHVRV